MYRIQPFVERVAEIGRRWGARVWTTARDPLRLMPIVAMVALLLVGVPYAVTGVSRVARAALHWRSEAVVRWRHTTGTVTGVRDADGLLARVTYRDDLGGRHVAQAYVADPTKKWLTASVPIRYDPNDFGRVKLVGFGDQAPVPALLIAGAPLGAGIGAIASAIGVWRRRRLLAVSARPISVLRRSLTVGMSIMLGGIGAWAAGTVLARGWSAIASATGHLVGTVFGDLLGVFVPVVTFALGCLVTAWLARHRNHSEHQGWLSSAHRLIDRAAGMVPSPEELGPDDPDRNRRHHSASRGVEPHRSTDG